MSRTSISFTPPNEKWIQEQIDSQEFMSKSDVINDLIRRARREREAEIEAIRAALLKGEESGISNRTPQQIMADVLAKRQTA